MDKKPQVTQPSENKTETERISAALTTVSSHVDPMPHYILGALCGSGSLWAYTIKNHNASLIAGGLALGFLWAGSKIQKGHVRQGYDIGSACSLALLAATAPYAYRTREAYSTSMATLGLVSSLGNVLKSYQVRTGKPKDLHIGTRTTG